MFVFNFIGSLPPARDAEAPATSPTSSSRMGSVSVHTQSPHTSSEQTEKVVDDVGTLIASLFLVQIQLQTRKLIDGLLFLSILQVSIP